VYQNGGKRATRRLRESVRIGMERESPAIFDDWLNRSSPGPKAPASPALKKPQPEPIPEVRGHDGADGAAVDHRSASTPSPTGSKRCKLTALKTEDLSVARTTCGIVPPPAGSEGLPDLSATGSLPVKKPPGRPVRRTLPGQASERPVWCRGSRQAEHGGPAPASPKQGFLEGAEIGARKGRPARTRTIDSASLQLEGLPKGELVYEEKMLLPGLPSIAESSVNIYADQDGSLTLEAVCHHAAGPPEKLVRECSKTEVERIISFGGMEDQSSQDFYDWLCRHLELVDGPKERLLLLRGYEEDRREVLVESIKPSLQDVFAATKERVRLSTEVQEKVDFSASWNELWQEERRSRAFEVLAKRLRIPADTVEALYLWHSRIDLNGDGRIDFDELASALQRAFEVADRAPLTKEQAFRFWKELQSATKETVLFPQFAAWVVAKFPYISAFPPGEVRSFTYDVSHAAALIEAGQMPPRDLRTTPAPLQHASTD